MSLQKEDMQQLATERDSLRSEFEGDAAKCFHVVLRCWCRSVEGDI